MSYKDANIEMHPDLKQFVSVFPTVPAKSRTTGRYRNKSNWKKPEKKIKSTWVTDAKKDKTDDEKLYLQIRGILNKLSASNFNELANEFIQLNIRSRDHLMSLVDIIFKKAIVESKFNEIYAKLCYELASYYIEDNDDKVYFRELLLNKCQQMFEESANIKILDRSVTVPVTVPVIETFKSKEQITGCIKFIGELYNINLLTNKVVYSCFLILLSKVSPGNMYTIDCICTLMQTINVKFVSSAPNEASSIYDRIEKLKNSDSTEKKDKFALMDILDLRKSKN
jgi:translation initiation factor 4G